MACGTAYLAGLTAKYLFEKIADLPVDVEIASEFRYRDPAVSKSTLALAISQSGETADTLAALKWCKAKGLKTGALVNAHQSTMAREADVMLPTNAGTEIGVASTKAFTAQVCALSALVIAAARERGAIDSAEEARLVAVLMEAPRLIGEALGVEDKVREIAYVLSKARDVLYLGRGLTYALALEGALKLKEISYIHAEGYAAGELKHGPIALIDEATPVVVIAPLRRPVRQDPVKHAGGLRPRRPHRHADRRGGPAPRPHAGRRDPGPRLRPLHRAPGLRPGHAASGVPCGGAQGHGRGPAAQPRQVGDGGVAARSE